MRTFSHAIITAAIGSKANVGRGSLIAFVVGSVLPDLPLGVLTLLAIVNTVDMSAAMVYMDEAYFSSPMWIALHNVPHSFVVMGCLSLLAYASRQMRWMRWMLWYTAGTCLHISADILTHVSDGPMFLYPLSTYRFESPVSYWHPNHYGRLFTLFEYSIDVLLVAILGLRFWKYRVQQRRN